MTEYDDQQRQNANANAFPGSGTPPAAGGWGSAASAAPGGWGPGAGQAQTPAGWGAGPAPAAAWAATPPPSAAMGTNVRVGFGQRMAGQGILMLLIVFALSGFAPVADPGGQILLNLIGVASCLVGVGIFVFTMRAIDAPLGERAAYWFGAYTHYQHGTVGRFHAAKNSLAFLLPGGMFAFLMFKGLN